MVFSPALRNRQRILAEQAAPVAAADTIPAPDPSTQAGQQYAALVVQLHEDLRTLKDIQSHEARNPRKAEMAKTYAPWIEGVLTAGEQGQAAQDEVVLTGMIWAVDYRDFSYALQIGAHAIRYGLAMPAPFTRSPACFLAEQIAELALADPQAGTIEQLLDLARITEDADMPDPVRAKLAKVLGRRFLAKAEDFDPTADNAPAGGKAAYTTAAQGWLKRAQTLDKKSGVTKDLEKVDRQLKALAPPQE